MYFSEACRHGHCEGSGCAFRWTSTFPLLAHHPLIQLISLPSRGATPPGYDFPSDGKLSSSSLKQLRNLGNKNYENCAKWPVPTEVTLYVITLKFNNMPYII